jgi:hypothetical protein
VGTFAKALSPARRPSGSMQRTLSELGPGQCAGQFLCPFVDWRQLPRPDSRPRRKAVITPIRFRGGLDYRQTEGGIQGKATCEGLGTSRAARFVARIKSAGSKKKTAERNALRRSDFPAASYSPVTPTVTVPSALRGLTAVFGMGTGVSPSPWRPETVPTEKRSDLIV